MIPLLLVTLLGLALWAMGHRSAHLEATQEAARRAHGMTAPCSECGQTYFCRDCGRCGRCGNRDPDDHPAPTHPDDLEAAYWKHRLARWALRGIALVLLLTLLRFVHILARSALLY